MALPSAANAQLATTSVPYMGWNTYYQLGVNFNESTIKSVANSLTSTGLQGAGYKLVWLDFGWATGQRDSNGNLIVSSTQWPHGMKSLTNWLHSHGFQAGIYTDAGTSGCSGQGVGSYGHYQQDANQFAAWGFDAVKVDFCGAGQTWLDQPPNDPRTLYAQFSNALANNASGRPMILNVDNFWVQNQINGSTPSFADSSWDNYSWAPAYAQSWRTDTDVGTHGSIQFANVLRNLRRDTGTAPSISQPGIASAAGPPGSTPYGFSAPVAWGHWNDPDYLGPGLGMTDIQAQSQFSMWAMVAAPLILGSDPRSLSSTSISMLKNSQVLAIDQDSLGAQGYLLSGQGTTAQVWVKPLANGDRAVALLNEDGSNSQQITTSASAIGMPGASQYQLLDVWANQTTRTNGAITATVPANSVVLYRVTPEGALVTTGSASNVGTTSATVSGTVNPNGQATTYHFDYGTSTSYGSQAPGPPDPSAGAGTTAQRESTTLTGLNPGTSYHYRLEATNASGTSYGSDQTFTTSSAGASLTATPPSVAGGGTVTVSWSGVPNPTTQDWIGLYHPGDPNSSYIDWFWTSSCTQTVGSSALSSGSCTFKMPNVAGTYELRLFPNDSYTLLATSNQVTVTSGSTTLTASPSSVAGGGSITVSWSGVPNPTTQDWIGLYHPGDPNSSYIDWLWTSSCTQTVGSSALSSGSCTFKMPLAAGTYELRLFPNDTYSLLARSSSVTVG